MKHKQDVMKSFIKRQYTDVENLIPIAFAVSQRYDL
jgi:hypothetical protein